jgi:DNA-binding transcriptional LysR family regulator
MEVDVRQLRYFVAAADDLNFTRAAERLHVVQQSLSSAIARLEAGLGFKLFERTSRTVALTERGAAWLPHARAVLVAATYAERAAADIAAGVTGTLRVGLAATAAVEITPRLLRSFAKQHPNIRLVTEHYGFDDPTGGLRDGATDVAIVRPPFTSDGLEMLVVATELRFAALAVGHPLARRRAVAFHELEDEPWIEVESDPVWCDFWRVNERRTKPPVFGARGRALDDLLEAARDGRATGLVPASIARSQRWPDLAFVRVADVPESKVAIAWRTTHQPAPVRDFVSLAGELALPDATGEPLAS